MISLVLLGFAYGVASVLWKTWPYPVVREALAAATSLKVLHDLRERPKSIVDQPAMLPPGTEGSVYRAPDMPDDDGLILVSGGPHQHRDICPDFGCVAWLMDRHGEIRHAWEVDPYRIWPNFRVGGRKVRATAFHPTSAHVYENGDLLVNFVNDELHPAAFGVARIDRSGNPLWSRVRGGHHWPTVEPDSGLIFLPEIEMVPAPLPIGSTGERLADCASGEAVEDWVRVLNPHGALLWEFSLVESLESSDLPGLLALAPNGCDPTHLNFVTPLNAAAARRIRGARTGDLLVSVRNLNALVIVGRNDGLVRDVITGRFLAQHNPVFLADGHILLLDNRGGDRAMGGSRVLRIDPESGNTEQVFPRPGIAAEFLPVFTEYLGYLDVSADEKRVLFTESRQGRIIEFELSSGKVTWAYVNDHAWRGPDGDLPARVTRFHNSAARYAGRPTFLEPEAAP